MKSATIAVALMASAAIAQPRGHHRRHQHHHEKRDVVVTWETTYVTITEIVDATSTETIYPSTAPQEPKTTANNVPGQFFQTDDPPASVQSSTVQVQAPPAPSSTSTTAPPPAPEPTTQAPAPAPTTQQAPPPVEAPTTSTTSTTAAAAPAPAPAEPSTPSTGGGSYGGADKRTGDITYYGIGLGSCGYDDAGKDQTMAVAAVSLKYFQNVSPLTNAGPNQPLNPLCDKTITISANGKTTTATIRDSCPGCDYDSVDVSEKVFKDLFGDLGIGRTKMTWWLNEPL